MMNKLFIYYICRTMEKEKKIKFYQELGDYLVDISKLVFGGVILAGIMNIENLDKATLFTIGGVVFAIKSSVGLFFKINNNK